MSISFLDFFKNIVKFADFQILLISNNSIIICNCDIAFVRSEIPL